MTYLGADAQRIKNRCEALEKAFELFCRCIDNYVSCFYEFQTTPVTCIGLRLSKTILLETVVFHFRDIDRYKVENAFPPGALANAIKVGAFMTYWLATKRPIYDTHDEPYAPAVNDDFALFAGLTFSEIDPHAARMIADGLIYKQIKALLSSHNASPDALVPLFQMLRQHAPSGSNHSALSTGDSFTK